MQHIIFAQRYPQPETTVRNIIENARRLHPNSPSIHR